MVLQWVEEGVVEDGGSSILSFQLNSSSSSFFKILSPGPTCSAFLAWWGFWELNSTDQGSPENILPLNSCAFSLASSFKLKPEGVLVWASVLIFSFRSHLIPREHNSGFVQTPFYPWSFWFLQLPVDPRNSPSLPCPLHCPRCTDFFCALDTIEEEEKKDTYIKYLHSIQLYNWFHAFLSMHLLPSVQLGSVGGKCRDRYLMLKINPTIQRVWYFVQIHLQVPDHLSNFPLDSYI